MSLVVFGAVRSSPGTTTAALAVSASLRGATFVDADPDGGCISARFGLAPEPNLATLAAAARAGLTAPGLDEHVQPLPGGLTAVTGLASPDRSAGLWRSAGATIAAALATTDDRVVVADVGRMTPSTPLQPLLAAADVRVVVVRPEVEELYPLAQRASVLQELGPLCVALVGDHPYGPDDVARHVGLPVAGVIALDRRAADALAGKGPSGRWSARSRLARTAGELAETLSRQLSKRAPDDEVHATEVSA